MIVTRTGERFVPHILQERINNSPNINKTCIDIEYDTVTANIKFDSTLDPAEIVELDNVIAEYTNTFFDDDKKKRASEIDARTGELIGEGFVFNSITFSLSILAQTNWIGLKQASQNNLITYPFGISTKDDDEYLLNSAQEVEDFYVTGLGVKIYHLGTGRALKIQIKAATTQAELDAVVDNR